MEHTWVTVTDENGVDFPGLIFGPEPEVDGHVRVWVFPDRESGFGFDVGAVASRELKRLGDGSGKYGA